MPLSNFIKDNEVDILIILLWLIANVFEMTGGRAEQIASSSFYKDLLSVLTLLIRKLSAINSIVFIVLLLIIVFGLWNIINNRDASRFSVHKFIISACLFLVYIILVSAKAGVKYIERCDVLYGFFFFVLFITLICLNNILSSYYQIKLFIPLFLVISLIACNSRRVAYRCSTNNGISEKLCYEIDIDLINQFIEADQNGLTELKLYVIDYDNDYDNFPMASYIGERISIALHKYGIISKELETTVVPCKDKNLLFSIND